MATRIQVPQDLHIHTVFSQGDSSVVPEQTVELVAQVAHARILGISDHIEFVTGRNYEIYADAVRACDLYLGVEVSSSRYLAEALSMDVEYYLFHCADVRSEYRAAERLAETGKPVIIAHPMMMDTDLGRVPPGCLVEINNRYDWQFDWVEGLGSFVSRFRWIISSDAHQPGWLGQGTARHIAEQLGIVETLLFPENAGR